MGDRELAELLSRSGIHDQRVLSAIAQLERSAFVPVSSSEVAGQDRPLPIGHGQTISQPFVVAFMTQALELRGHERVLEIGTGSGYQAAVLAQLCAEVYTVEIIPELARAARERLERLGLGNVHVRQGDGTLGWPQEAPFDAIMGTAAPERLPPSLLEQLRPGGRLVLPVGPTGGVQELIRVTRPLKENMPEVERLLPVRFVPMTTEEPPSWLH